jgi:broad specificity phosphatase PhoE
VLVLVRHGEATANAAGLLLGRSDVSLTDKGRAQAAELHAHLAGASALLSSPLRRCLDTAEALRLDVPIGVDARWIELDYGEHEGQPLGDLPAELWRRWRADPAYRPAGGESLADVSARVRDACQELFAPSGPARTADVVVVSHVSPIKAAVEWALGAGEPLAWRLHLSTGSVTRIGWGSDGPVLHTYNWTPGASGPASAR